MVERRLENLRRAPRREQAEELANQAQYEVWRPRRSAHRLPDRKAAWSATLFAYWATKRGQELRTYYRDNAESMQAAPPAGVQAHLLRDVAGNPFRPSAVDRAWLTPAVSNLAAVAYEERSLPSGELDAVRLSVLADALEEAGCSDADLLGHLRSAGPHVRGCWALDVLLGKG